MLVLFHGMHYPRTYAYYVTKKFSVTDIKTLTWSSGTINLFANDKHLTADVFPATKIYDIFSFNWVLPVKSFELLGSSPLFAFFCLLLHCSAAILHCVDLWLPVTVLFLTNNKILFDLIWFEKISIWAPSHKFVGLYLGN